MVEKHCETCECNDLNSLSHSLSRFDMRIRRAMQVAQASILRTLPVEVLARLNPSSMQYALGFTGLKASSSNQNLAGQFLAALYPVPFICWSRDDDPSPRFFGVCTLGPIQLGMSPRSGDSPVTPRAFEYRQGDCFFIGQSPTLEDIELMNSWSDEQVQAYLLAHLEPLRDIVIAAAGGEPVPMNGDAKPLGGFDLV